MRLFKLLKSSVFDKIKYIIKEKNIPLFQYNYIGPTSRHTANVLHNMGYNNAERKE